MANSKKDFSIVSKMFIDLINNLTEEQFNNLVNGGADIKYYEKGLDNEKKAKYDNILIKISTIDNLEEKINYIKNNEELSTKSKLTDFCQYSKVDFKVKDTIDVIIKKIIDYADNNKDNIIYKYNKEEDLETSIDRIAKLLENSMDVEEAKNLIINTKILESKSNLLKLSKKLNVFTDRESPYENILNNIIRSVVESKIRSYTIRKKI